MIVPTPSVSDLALPPDDGVIGRAIEELRTKIAVWSRAMIEVESRLGDQAAEPHEEPIQPASDVSVSAEQQAGLEATADIQAIPPTAEVGLTNASDEGQDAEQPSPTAMEPGDETDAARSEAPIEERTPEPESESEADIEARLESLDPTVANTVRRKRREVASDEPISSLIEACDLELHDDDDLIASLAPEVAEAIRVEHRLFNGRRSIRELIEAHRDDPVESGEKRHWWQREKR